MRAFGWLLLWLISGWAQAQSVEGVIYSPGPFERLEVAGSARVLLTQGQRDQIFIAGDEGVQRSVEMELQGDRLVIRPLGGWKFWISERVHIEVMMRSLRELVLSGPSDLHAPGLVRAQALNISLAGAGQVRFDELQAERLSFGIAGAGLGQLRGQVEELNLAVSGKGKLAGEDLRSARAAVAISGLGSATLWVSEELRVSVTGIGRVDYWGTPELRRTTSGLANVTALGKKR